MLLPCAIRFLAGIGFGAVGAPSLETRFIIHCSLPFVQASIALPTDFHAAGDSHLVW